MGEMTTNWMRQRRTFGTGARAMLFALLASAAYSPAAMAQAAPTGSGSAAEAPAAGDDVVVTGTRIRNQDAASANPISVIGNEQLQASGSASLDRVLLNVPQSGAQGQNASGRAGGQDGNSFLDLRSLGPRRTLVLLDGQRVVPAFGSVAFGVNVNLIPTSIVDHVEVLRDGASPIYGSDAVAGVINIVTKKRLDGLQASAELGGATDGGRFSRHFSLLFGKRSSDVDLIAGLDYVKRDGVEKRQRDFATTNIASQSFAANGSAVLVPGSPASAGATILNTAGQPSLVADGNGLTHPYTTADNFILDPRQNLVTPDEELAGFLSLNVKLAEGVKAFVQANYLYSHTVDRQSFLALQGGNAKYPTLNTVPVTNPYNSFGRPVTILRTLTELGLPTYDTKGDTYRVVAGVRGDAGRFSWEASYNYGLAVSTNFYRNFYDLGRLQRSLDPALCATDPACVVANPFGPGSLAPAASYFRTTNRADNRYQQSVIALSLNGPLLELPAGSLSIAVGAEHRHESGSLIPDPGQLSLDSVFGARTVTAGAFDADEAYGELNVPILKDVPFFKHLTVDLAGRYSHYRPFGTAATWKAGVDWAVSGDLRLRANISTAFRAPAISEAFLGAVSQQNNYADPCDTVTGQRSDPRVATNCQAAGLGSTFRQAFTRTLIQTSGNVNLRPERARNFTAGIVLTPHFIPGLTVTADYWRIRLNQAISTVSAAFVLNGCYQTDNRSSPLCNSVVRDPSGQVTTILVQQQNVGVIRTDGMDASLQYAFNLGGAGRISVDWENTILFNFLQQNTPDTTPQQFAGSLAQSNAVNGGFPRYRSTLIFRYDLHKWSLGGDVRYISGMRRADANPVIQPFYKVPAVAYLDLNTRYDFDRFSITAGLNNALGKKPPFVVNGYNYDSNTYDLIGRYAFVRLDLKL
jgi:iron complex outermembrane receptor protein